MVGVFARSHRLMHISWVLEQPEQLHKPWLWSDGSFGSVVAQKPAMIVFASVGVIASTYCVLFDAFWLPAQTRFCLYILELIATPKEHVGCRT